MTTTPQLKLPVTNGMSAKDVWTYSTDGTTFNSLSNPSYTSGNSNFATTTLDLSTLSSNALDNQSNFYLRLNFDSASNSGNYSYDNIQVTGSAIPEPSSLLLLLVSGLGFAFLRRKR